MNAAEAGDDARRRRAAPLFVHAERGVSADLEELAAGIEQQGKTLARGEAALLVLRLDRIRAAALADFFFLVVDPGDQVGHGAHVLLEARRSGVDAGLDDAVCGRRCALLGTVCHQEITGNWLRYTTRGARLKGAGRDVSDPHLPNAGRCGAPGKNAGRTYIDATGMAARSSTSPTSFCRNGSA